MNKLEYAIALVGESGVGKTTILNTFLYGPGKRVSDSTIICDWPRKTVGIRDETVKLQLRDTAGQERYGAISRMYFRGCSAVIFVYDTTQPQTKDKITEWIERAGEGCDMAYTKTFLVGNKVDLKEEREVSFEDGRQFAEERDMTFLETSAIEGVGVQELFLKVAAAVHDDPNLPEEATNFRPVASGSVATDPWCNC